MTTAESTQNSSEDQDPLQTGDPAIPQQWPHVAGLKPQLQRHIKAYPQEFRGARWYILADAATGRHLRFNQNAYEFIGRLDGDQTVQEIYSQIETTLGDQCPSRSDILNIMMQLHSISAMKSGIPADVEQIFNRNKTEKTAQKLRRLMNPLAIRFPLIDPDNFLNRAMPHVRSLISITGAVTWLVVVSIALLMLLVHYSDLTYELKANVLSPQNILLMILIFPVMKTFHEFAHAFAVKAWGGEVHEMGITLLILMPVPYVDASAAWAFREKYKRVFVSAAGMIVELFIASIALIAWAWLEPGVIRDAALSAFLIGSVSTLLFNANPLLRFDGYYILQDLVEIPNLYTRSAKYNLYLLQTYLLGQDTTSTPATEVTERKWLAIYGVLALLYRIFITFVIAFFLASKYLVLGVLLATWALTMMFVVPAFKALRYLLFDPSIASNRRSVLTRVSVCAGALLAFAFLLPFSLHTNAEGIVWVPDQAQIFAETDGFVESQHGNSGSVITPGSSVVTLVNADLEKEEHVLLAKQKELNARYVSQRVTNPHEADLTAEELEILKADLASLQNRRESQILKSQTEGVLVFPNHQDMIGRYVKKGDPIAYVVNPDQLIVRLVVPQSAVGLFTRGISSVEVRLADNISDTVQAKVIRQTPSGSHKLPSRALGAAGGGEIAIVRNDEAGTTTADKVFQIDLSLPKDIDVSGLGTRAFVRISHGKEILANQWLRRIRQLFLNKLPI